MQVACRGAVVKQVQKRCSGAEIEVLKRCTCGVEGVKEVQMQRGAGVQRGAEVLR